MDVQVAAGADVPGLATHLMEMVKTVLAGSLGLQVYGQPEIRIKVAPAPASVVKKAPAPVESPLPPQPAAPIEKPQEWAGPPPLPGSEDRRA